MIKPFADWLVFTIIGLAPGTAAGEALDFFIYDTLKIFLLLTAIIYVVAIIRTSFPPEKTKRMLSHKREYAGNVLAALLGIVTPFCSCSAVPLFIGFVESGVPLGVTFSFLIAAPMINEVALVMLFGLFGWKIAFLYILSGLIIAILSGILIGRMKIENLVEPFVYQTAANAEAGSRSMSWRERLAYAREYVADILKRIWLYVLIGVGVGAWIHGYVPADFLAAYAGSGRWYAVPLAVLIGIPLYSNAAGVIPLVSALTEKGVAMGTTLAFMMSVTALSLPEFMILKKVMKTRLIVIFAGVVGTGIMFTGFLFNAIL